jgi:hypothetical protein
MVPKSVSIERVSAETSYSLSVELVPFTDSEVGV